MYRKTRYKMMYSPHRYPLLPTWNPCSKDHGVGYYDDDPYRSCRRIEDGIARNPLRCSPLLCVLLLLLLRMNDNREMGKEIITNIRKQACVLVTVEREIRSGLVTKVEGRTSVRQIQQHSDMPWLF